MVPEKQAQAVQRFAVPKRAVMRNLPDLLVCAAIGILPLVSLLMYGLAVVVGVLSGRIFYGSAKKRTADTKPQVRNRVLLLVLDLGITLALLAVWVKAAPHIIPAEDLAFFNRFFYAFAILKVAKTLGVFGFHWDERRKKRTAASQADALIAK